MVEPRAHVEEVHPVDGDKFDQLTKSLTGGTSRRGLLRILGGSVLGGVLGAGGLSTATAACLDDCARRPTARARTICRRSCAQRGRTAPAQAQRGQSTSPQAPSCPPGRIRLSNGTCAISCRTENDCPGFYDCESEQGCPPGYNDNGTCFGGCASNRTDPQVCTTGRDGSFQQCVTNSECPLGETCVSLGADADGNPARHCYPVC